MKLFTLSSPICLLPFFFFYNGLLPLMPGTALMVISKEAEYSHASIEAIIRHLVQ